MSEALARTRVARQLVLVASSIVTVFLLWNSFFAGRLPWAWGPTVERTLYFKLPIESARFHWRFADAEALLAGELTLRIINDHRDETLVVFRDGEIRDGWQVVGADRPSHGEIYFGFLTDDRFRTAPSDSLILTLTATQDLRGRGAYGTGVLRAGTYSATGTYSSLRGGTWNPINRLALMGRPPVAYLQCWDGVWPLEPEASTTAASSPLPENVLVQTLNWALVRGADGRRCASHV